MVGGKRDLFMETCTKLIAKLEEKKSIRTIKELL